MTTEKQEKKTWSPPWGTQLLTRRSQYALDLAIIMAAFVLAYLLRFDFAIPEKDLFRGLVQLSYVVLLQFGMLLLAGVYTFIWKFVGMAEIRAFLNAAIWSALPVLMLRIGLPDSLQLWRVPLSVIVIDTVLAFGGVLGARVLRRGLYERYEKRPTAANGSNGKRKSVLLVGAGAAGVMAAKEILSCVDMNLEVKGFVDDDSGKQGALIQGIKVLGATQDLPSLVKELRIDHVVITIALASRQEISRIVRICEQIPVKVRIIPGLSEILEGKVEVNHIRNVEIEDLLGREPVQLDEEEIGHFLTGKTVMVTGAGGSIGSELARQAIRFQPSHLLLVERAEFALFEIERKLREVWPDQSMAPLVADVSDEARMQSIFAAYQPQVVLHAAAHKHVPMMEANPSEAVKNNVLATRVLGELAGQYQVQVFVLISTDKAVRPSSVMGASKRMAELVVQDLDRRFATRYVAVRFGNVIGSAGSVIPIFREQIRKGGPVTVTHPDMMRYFMTIPEAAQLVLQAAAMGEGGEIFVLDMGEPVRILDLAKDTITLSGLKPFEDINIVFTGIRAGEKLSEELVMSEEQITKTRHPKIFIGKIATYSEEKVRYALNRLAALCKEGPERELRGFLNELLPSAQLDAYQAPASVTSQIPVAASGQPFFLDESHSEYQSYFATQHKAGAD